MKKFQILLVSFILIISSSCRVKPPVSQPQPLPPTAPGFGELLFTPCANESMDDKEYFRGLGIGTDVIVGNARTAALKSAQSEIKLKLGGFVQGLTSDYSRTMAGKMGENTQRAMEGELIQVVNKTLNDAEKICEQTLQDKRGTFNTFITLQIPKKELMTKMENSLSADEELNIEFNRDQFRKFAAERMKAMEDTKKNP